jgi:hypothetical protein
VPMYARANVRRGNFRIALSVSNRTGTVRVIGPVLQQEETAKHGYNLRCLPSAYVYLETQTRNKYSSHMNAYCRTSIVEVKCTSAC